MQVDCALGMTQNSVLKIVMDPTFKVRDFVYVTACGLVYRYVYTNFMVTPCINNIQHFNFQLMHTALKNVELLKHFKISKTAPSAL